METEEDVDHPSSPQQFTPCRLTWLLCPQQFSAQKVVIHHHYVRSGPGSSTTPEVPQLALPLPAHAVEHNYVNTPTYVKPDFTKTAALQTLGMETE